MSAKSSSSDVEQGSTIPIEKTTYEPVFEINITAQSSGIIGDIEESPHVHRSLKARHVQFIGLGGTLGTALFLGIGRGLTAAGPLSLLLGFSITGVAVFGMMQCLGELTTWLPLPAALPIFASRYLDDAFGFALGWNSYYGYAIGICTEISAASVIIEYWNSSINVAVWITIIIVLLVALNFLAVTFYGEAEFWFAVLKIITLVGLLILALVLDLGGAPNHDRLGFRYWKNPGPMRPFVFDGATGRFCGFFFSIVIAALSYAGIESVVVAAGEAKDPRRNLPKAIRRVFWRILLFYVFGSLAVGVLVPYNDGRLLTAQGNQEPGAAGSPWVIAITRVGIPVLPSIINAVILISAASAGNSMLYNGSRYLMSMAQIGLAPKIFLRCSKKGVPYYSVGLTSLVTLLTYLSCSSGPAKVFVWLANLATMVDRETLPFKSPFQPYLAWACVVFFSIVLLFNGFYAFAPWNANTFITAYIGVPIFLALFLFWKLFKRTKFVKPAEADIWTGKAAIDAKVWPITEPKNTLEKFWAWLM